MKLSLSTGSLMPYPLRSIFALAKEAGFDGLELVLSVEVFFRGGEYVRCLVEEYEMPVLSLHPPIPAILCSDAHKVIPWQVELARRLDCPVIVLHTPKATRWNAKAGRSYLETVLAFRRQMEGSGIKLALENRAFYTEKDGDFLLCDLRDLREFADRYDLAMVLDTSHVGTSLYELDEAWPLFDGRLANVHLSDVQEPMPFFSNMALLDAVLRYHQMPGEGRLPLADFLRSLAANAYQGPITLEVTPFAMGTWWPPLVRRNLKKFMYYIRDILSRGKACLAPTVKL